MPNLHCPYLLHSSTSHPLGKEAEMLQGANSIGKAVAKTKLTKIKSKNARASLANITMLFPPDAIRRRGWSYVQLLTFIFLAVLVILHAY